MAGGTFTTQNKKRPGAYVNVTSNGTVGTSESTAGVVALPIALDFGPEKEIVEVNPTSDLTQFGYDLGHPKMLLLAQALKRAFSVLVYRVGTGTKASANQDTVTATAKFGGTRGDAINITATQNVNDEMLFDVKTYLESRLVDTQTVKNAEELKENQLVTFGGEGAVTAFSIALTGGTSTSATAQDYSDFFNAVQLYDFNTIALPVADDSVKAAGASFIKRMRDEEGKKAQIAIAGYSADNEGVINVKNGVILEDGTTITAEQATAWVAGATAGAGTAESLTYTVYDGAVDVDKRFTNSEIIEALRKGEFLFTEKRGQAVVEQDINSFISFSAEKSQDFSKNRVLRVLDDIANNAKETFEDNFIGKVNNDVDGRELFKADRIAYFDTLQAQGAITNFTAEDVTVEAGASKDAVVMTANIQPVDAMEKLYVTVEVL